MSEQNSTTTRRQNLDEIVAHFRSFHEDPFIWITRRNLKIRCKELKKKYGAQFFRSLRKLHKEHFHFCNVFTRNNLFNQLIQKYENLVNENKDIFPFILCLPNLKTVRIKIEHKEINDRRFFKDTFFFFLCYNILFKFFEPRRSLYFVRKGKNFFTIALKFFKEISEVTFNKIINEIGTNNISFFGTTNFPNRENTIAIIRTRLREINSLIGGLNLDSSTFIQ